MTDNQRDVSEAYRPRMQIGYARLGPVPDGTGEWETLDVIGDTVTFGADGSHESTGDPIARQDVADAFAARLLRYTPDVTVDSVPDWTDGAESIVVRLSDGRLYNVWVETPGVLPEVTPALVRGISAGFAHPDGTVTVYYRDGGLAVASADEWEQVVALGGQMLPPVRFHKGA